MTLIEKYCDLVDNDNGFDNNLLAERCGKIADEFAIKFAMWCFTYDRKYPEHNYDTTQLLEIYKKEKGL